MRSLALLALLVLNSCSSDVVDVPGNGEEDPPPAPYTVSGIVIDSDDEPVPAVLLDFGSFGTATTGLDGTWSKSGLEGTVTITPSREGWGFSPGSHEVNASADNVTFVGNALITQLEILVEWDEVGETSAGLEASMGLMPQMDGTTEITHIGTRLEYPDDNAFFAQSLDRDEAEEFGLITLEVPPAEQTHLFVAAVRVSEGGEGQPGQRDPIVWFGQVRDLEIEEGSSTTVRMDEVEWVEPVWQFESDEVQAAYESGTMEGDKDETNLEFWITVRDPFQDRPWDEFIGLTGTGGAQPSASEEGWWNVRVQCRNAYVGQEHESTCRFWPYLHSERFNLQDVRFTVPPIAKDFMVEWK